MNPSEKIKPEEVKIKVGEIVLPKLDLKQYIGKKAKISACKVLKGEFNKGEPSYYVHIETNVIDKLKRGEKTIELCASRNFGLSMDIDGNIGWSPETKLGQFLTAKRCKDLNSLVGREVQVQLTDDEKFLSFI
jgi:hypothetical protein